MEILDTTSFENAISRLKEAINLYGMDESNLIVRDSLIQRFEYTYSLALKMIKRYFTKSAFADENVEGMTFNEMIRQANKMDLLASNLEIWTVYRNKRNLTSHTYDENAAKEVVAVLDDFYEEVVFLLKKLKDKLK